MTGRAYPKHSIKRVDRLLGELGIPKDSTAGREQLEQYLEARRGQEDPQGQTHLCVSGQWTLHARKPDLLVLDEPGNGLDPAGLQELRHFLRQLAREDGITLFLSSHLLTDLSLCVCTAGGGGAQPLDPWPTA